MMQFPQPDTTMMAETAWLIDVLHYLLYLFFPLTLGGVLVCTVRQTFLPGEVGENERARWRHILFFLTGTTGSLIAVAMLVYLVTHASLLYYIMEPMVPYLLLGAVGLLLLTIVPILSRGRRKSRFRLVRWWMMLIGLIFLTAAYTGGDAWMAHPIAAQFDPDTLTYVVDDYLPLLLHSNAWEFTLHFVLLSAIVGMVMLGLVSPSRKPKRRVGILLALLILITLGDLRLLKYETTENPNAAAALLDDPYYRPGALRIISLRMDTARKTVLDPINYQSGKTYMNLQTMKRSEAHFKKHRSTMGYAGYQKAEQYLPPHNELYYNSRIHLVALAALLILTLVNAFEKSRTGVGLTVELFTAVAAVGSFFTTLRLVDAPWLIHEQMTAVTVVQSHETTLFTLLGWLLIIFYGVLFAFFLFYLNQQRTYTQK